MWTVTVYVVRAGRRDSGQGRTEWTRVDCEGSSCTELRPPTSTQSTEPTQSTAYRHSRFAHIPNHSFRFFPSPSTGSLSVSGLALGVEAL